MQIKGAPRILVLLALAAPVSGCGALGLDPAATPTTAAPGASGPSWIEVVQGRPTASATPARGARATASPSPAPWKSADPSCGRTREPEQVLIPLTVTVRTGSLAVQWPGYGGSSGYRVAAVPQILVNGEQPPVKWQAVGAGDGCTISATITGLTSGAPYIVWLDAPGSGRLIDGTRLPYSGRSAVVYPG
jgi:hypothetical protein